jgi:hypothetical protein
MREQRRTARRTTTRCEVEVHRLAPDHAQRCAGLADSAAFVAYGVQLARWIDQIESGLDGLADASRAVCREAEARGCRPEEIIAALGRAGLRPPLGGDVEPWRKHGFMRRDQRYSEAIQLLLTTWFGEPQTPVRDSRDDRSR